jgi:DNA-binding PadR family transcriptional regulator
LESAGVVARELDDRDRRKINYRLTEKGIDLAPVMLELLIWGARHEASGARRGLIEEMESNREQIVSEVRRRWRERDSTPLFLDFRDSGIAGGRARSRRRRPARLDKNKEDK